MKRIAFMLALLLIASAVCGQASYDNVMMVVSGSGSEQPNGSHMATWQGQGIWTAIPESSLPVELRFFISTAVDPATGFPIYQHVSSVWAVADDGFIAGSQTVTINQPVNGCMRYTVKCEVADVTGFLLNGHATHTIHITPSTPPLPPGP